MENFITLSSLNIEKEHICCAISDKKCAQSYQLKKDWLKTEFENGYVFRRLNARAKVFIEYCPAEKAWQPIDAPNYLAIQCFWVSGQYKGKGYGKALLQSALDDARQQGKSGLVTVVGSKKFHFMSDTKWLLKQGFVECDKTSDGFSLLVKKIDTAAKNPLFMSHLKTGQFKHNTGLLVYYTNRCPFSEYHVTTSLVETAQKRKLPLTVIKFETLEQAKNAATPATIFSLFYNGQFVTTDLSVCMDSRFDKIVKI